MASDLAHYAELLFNKFVAEKGLNIPHLSIDDFKDQKMMVSNIYYNGPLIATDIFALLPENKLYALFIANGKLLGADQKMVGRASRLAHYHMIKWATENGIKEVSLGALGERYPDNIRFKKSFGGYEKQITQYKKVYNPLLKLALRVLK